jgi:MoaA/NifB/PqqE/SkfB family radical SAM enzyme
LAGPTHAIVAVTNRCNARCKMCDIWKKGPGQELKPQDYARLPASLKEINVTGGEPLLREDLGTVISVMKARCPGVRIVLSTNGLLPDRLRRLLGQTGEITVRVSMDGVGALHDSIRGVEGAYGKALETLKAARSAGIRDLGVCATMGRANAGLIREVQQVARSQRVHFTFTVVHSSPVFFGEKSDQQPPTDAALADMMAVRDRMFGSGRPKDWFKAYFVEGMMDVVRGRPRPLTCRAGTDFFYLDAEGNVYPCHLWDRPMGNIIDETYDEIIGRNRKTLEAVGSCGRRCWMTCTVAPEMRRRLPLYAARVGWAKVRHHMRVFARPK